MATKKSRSKTPGGRVTAKGTRPPGVTERSHEHGERGYDPHETGAPTRPVPTREGARRPTTFRTGHRGG
jgi:hypothetical protein